MVNKDVCSYTSLNETPWGAEWFAFVLQNRK